MTAPNNIDTAAVLIAFLSSQNPYRTAAGHAVTVTWHDELENTAGKDSADVYGTVRRLTPRVQDRIGFAGKAEDDSSTATDTLTYTTAASVYPVSQRDVTSVASLTGTVGGSPHSFARGTDYEVVEYDVPGSGEDYVTPSAIQWLAGGAKPDDGAQFTVTYHHLLVGTYRATRFHETFRLTIHARDATISGATYAKSRLGEQVYEHLVGILTAKRGLLLAEGFKLRDWSGVGQISLTPGEKRSRHFIDVRATRLVKVVSESNQRVGRLHLIPVLDGE